MHSPFLDRDVQSEISLQICTIFRLLSTVQCRSVKQNFSQVVKQLKNIISIQFIVTSERWSKH